jgi:endogenous inhibitor of DNA gyrase (YacG/DUF329 family)
MALCPICSQAAANRSQNPAYPFCTPRCKQIDLGKWLSEDYRVPVPDESGGEDPAYGTPAEEKA